MAGMAAIASVWRRQRSRVHGAVGIAHPPSGDSGRGGCVPSINHIAIAVLLAACCVLPVLVRVFLVLAEWCRACTGTAFVNMNSNELCVRQGAALRRRVSFRAGQAKVRRTRKPERAVRLAHNVCVIIRCHSTRQCSLGTVEGP